MSYIEQLKKICEDDSIESLESYSILNCDYYKQSGIIFLYGHLDRLTGFTIKIPINPIRSFTGYPKKFPIKNGGVLINILKIVNTYLDYTPDIKCIKFTHAGKTTIFKSFKRKTSIQNNYKIIEIKNFFSEYGLHCGLAGWETPNIEIEYCINGKYVSRPLNIEIIFHGYTDKIRNYPDISFKMSDNKTMKIKNNMIEIL